jgi:N-acetylmuramoyl-L-alanine amidase
VPSPNHDARSVAAPDIVVLHYTDMASADAAVAWLCNPASKVSAHYLVTAGGEVVQMVDEERRAWHAGASGWDGTRDINHRSIGIELDNPGHRPHPPTFPGAQIDSLLRLLDGIRARWPVPPRNVVAHSDIAPTRKIDPGEAFPWRRLAAAGHALHVEPAAPVPFNGPSFASALARSGYFLDPDWMDALGTAFHRRHLPALVHVRPNGASLATALALAAATDADRAGTGVVSAASSR